MNDSGNDPEPSQEFDPTMSGDRRRMPAHLKRTRRKRPSPKPAVTERVVEQRKEPLAQCARCGTPLSAASTGRPRVYCTPACRKAAYEDRRAGRPDAVRVQLVDRVVTQTIERTVRRPHRRAECVATVMANPHAIRQVLIELSRQVGAKKITPTDEVFWDLVTSTEYLSEALRRAALH